VSARRGAIVLAAGRLALGVAILLEPERVTAGWLGRHAANPAVRYLARSLGARDLALGALALASIDDPRLGPRAQAACALVDSVDALATLAARSELPVAGMAGTVAVAGAAAGAGFVFSRRLTAV
jgi:hypothetical protein